MLDFMAEQQCQSVGINPPHERSDAEQRSLVRNQLQLHRGPSLQQCFRSDFRTMRADVHGSCQVSIRPYLDEQRPRHAGSRMVPSVLLSCNGHEGSITAIRVPKRGAIMARISVMALGGGRAAAPLSSQSPSRDYL